MQNQRFDSKSYTTLHIIQTFINTINNVDELFARRRESWILKALRKMFGLREVFESEANVLADLIQLTLLLNEVLASGVQRGCFGVDKFIFFS